MFKRLRQWWNLRHYRKAIVTIAKLNNQAQLGLAQAVIASIAVPLTRDRRHKFLKFQTDKIEEMTKALVQNNRPGQR